MTSAIDPGEPAPHAEPLSARVARLAADPTYVRLEGLHCVKHALRFGADVVQLVTADREAALRLARSLAPDVHARLEADLVEVEAGTVLHLLGPGRYDVVGIARRSSPIAARGTGPTILLEEPRNLGNLGAAVRVAAGFGARAVRTTGSVDPWHPTVVRAAAGLHYAVDVDRVDLDGVALPGDGRWLAFDPAGQDLREVRIPDDAVLAFGSERHGLSQRVRRRADSLVAIPMADLVSSYNLATSVAVALFHWKSTGGAKTDRR